MKSFRTIVSEVAQPRGPEEKKFKDMHSYETKSHPVAPDAVFTGAIGADDLPKAKAKRKADQDGDVNYDKQFKEGKAYGPTGVSYYVPDGHEDEVDPATGKKKNSKKEGLDYNPAKGEYNQKPGKEVGKRVGTREAAVNELSKATLGSYAKKAVSDIDQQKKKADGYDKAANRSNNFKTITKNINKASSADHRADNRKKGIVKAVDKLTREELELEINEDLKMVSSEPHPKGGHIVTLVDKSGKKVIRHLKKGKVTDMGSRMKSSKYDEETQLDELSKKTLGAYAKAASNDQADHAQDTGKHYANNANYKGAMSSWEREKRRKGVKMAVNKLMKKEEVEQVDELDKKTLGSYIKKAGPDAVKQTAQAKRHSDAGDMADKDRDMYKAYGKSQRAMDKAKNRQKGINKAVDKLTKEATADPATVHTVDIDHTGEHDSAAKKHNITIKKSKGTADSHSATGKKKDLQKYLAHHYDSAEDAKDIHPEVHETTMSAVRKPVTVTGPDGKTRTVMRTTKNKRTDDHGQDIIKAEEAVDEGILDNIKKKVNDVRRKVVGPNQAEKDAARKKMMARQHASTMKRIGSAMGAVAKKDKAAENVENQRKESKAEVNAIVKAALGGKTKVKESLLDMFASKLRGDSE